MPIRVASVCLFTVSTVVFAQREAKPESGARPPPTIPPIRPFPQRITGPTYVASGAISYLSRRFRRLYVGTGDERTWICVPKDCQITVAGKSASLDDLAIGQWVKINYGARLHDAVWIIAATRSGEWQNDRAKESTISSIDSSGTSAQQSHDPESQEGASRTANEDSKSASGETPAPGNSYHDRDVAGLRDQLVMASPAAQLSLLESVRDAKGALNTNALASAIPLLHGDMRMKTREALAERLSRMTRSTLKEKLGDESDEVRRATALACAMKEEKALIPDLIDLLADPKPRVGRAARASLMALTHEDFGPTDSVNTDQVTRSVELWRQWWVRNGALTASSRGSE